MTKMLLQHGAGRPGELLDIVGTHHARVCQRLGYRYVCTKTERPLTENPYYEKIDAIIAALKVADDGDLIVWMDCDCVIMRVEDFNWAMSSGHALGLVEECRSTDRRRSWNGGVQIMRACDALREYFAEHRRLGALQDGAIVDGLDYRDKGDDGRTNWLIKSGRYEDTVRPVSIDAKWNWSRVTRRPRIDMPTVLSYPVVEGFHCENHHVKVTLMKDRLRRAACQIT